MILCHNHTRMGRNLTFVRIPKVTQNKQTHKNKQTPKTSQHQKEEKSYFSTSVYICLILNKKHVLYKILVLKLEHALKFPGGCVKTQTVGPHRRVSDSVGLGWGASTCISNKFSSETEASGPGTTLCGLLM